MRENSTILIFCFLSFLYVATSQRMSSGTTGGLNGESVCKHFKSEREKVLKQLEVFNKIISGVKGVQSKLSDIVSQAQQKNNNSVNNTLKDLEEAVNLLKAVHNLSINEDAGSGIDFVTQSLIKRLTDLKNDFEGDVKTGKDPFAKLRFAMGLVDDHVDRLEKASEAQRDMKDSIEEMLGGRNCAP